MKPMLLRLQTSTNESIWGMGVMLGAAGPGLTSTTPEEQRRSRIRVLLKAKITCRLVRREEKEQVSGRGRIDSRHNVQKMVW